MATEKRLIDANALADRLDKRIEWLRLDVHDKYSLGLYHGAATDKDLIGEIPTVVAFTEEQLANILEAAGKLETRNQKLEKELVWLKNCINCEIRKECPRHCGKVVHGCDHWRYGDSTVDVLTPKGCASVALLDAGLVHDSNDPVVDTFWNSFHSLMLEFGYAAEGA